LIRDVNRKAKGIQIMECLKWGKKWKGMENRIIQVRFRLRFRNPFDSGLAPHDFYS
jgi:hypothetical protein